MNLREYIINNCVRGACTCGKCADAPLNPENYQPSGHTADLVFFKVSAKPDANADTLRKLVMEHKGEFCECNLFDGREHSYMEIGGWIGDQGLAMMLMGLGQLLGLWNLLTPRIVLGNDLSDDLVKELAGSGFVCIKA